MTDYEMEYNTIQWTGASYDRNNLKYLKIHQSGFRKLHLIVELSRLEKRVFDIISVEKFIPYL